MVSPPGSGAEVDMPSLRRRSLAAVWKSALPFLLLGQAPWLAIFLWQGWPTVPVDELPSETLLWTAVANTVASNAPDICSIAVYAKMMWHFRRSVQPAHHQVYYNNDDQISVISKEYGGIWVGEEEEENQAQPPPPPPPENTGHESKSVMRVLRWHVSLCLADAAVTASAAVLCSPAAGKAAYHAYVLVNCFWVPLIVVTSNFRQLRGCKGIRILIRGMFSKGDGE